ncbi:MAG TPA: peptide ligase PGM1-related protein [Saprospiraceae bacterium]|nr:peptide ligase PGM1-related protein [Saprospiraceae bacterium]
MNNESKFNVLQLQFIEQYEQLFQNRLAKKTVVVIPSLTLDNEILSKISGHCYYEERMLCLLLLLKMPETRVTFVTSLPISGLIIDYYLHMLPGITPLHARNRLTLLSCYDSGNEPLTEKILKRPRLIQRIKDSIHDIKVAHVAFFNITESEKKLTEELNIPVYGCNPALNYIGSKSGSRKLFKECNVPVPYGFEDLYTKDGVIKALADLYIANPSIEKAVVKINEGFSGDGNAIFNYTEMPSEKDLVYDVIKANFKNNLKIVASNLKYSKFISKLIAAGGIVEEFVRGDKVTSPSVQCRINPLGEVSIISTHDQVLSGEGNQVFIGATFPADHEYSREISDLSYAIASSMKDLGVLGRFSIDFMSVKSDNHWLHYAIEINLRKGGTTHPYLMLQFLTDGKYDKDSGCFHLENGEIRYYYATDNLVNEAYIGLIPQDLIDIVMYHGLHYDHTKEEGVMFHLISALSQYGKVGLVSIGSSHERAFSFYRKVVEVLDLETSKH